MDLTNYLHYLAYAAVYFLLILLLEFILNRMTRRQYAASEAIAAGNHAIALRRAGAQLGLAIGMLGVLSGEAGGDFLDDLALSAGYGALAAAFMLLSLQVTDRLLLPGVDNTKELRDGNLAVGVLEFGALLMTGIIAYASVKGDDGGVWSSLIYFAAGQASMVLLILAYEKLTPRIDLVNRIQQGELACGIYLAAKAIAYGLILQSAIVSSGGGDFLDNAQQFLFVALAGVVMLAVFEFLADKLVVTGATVAELLDENRVAASLQLASVKIGVALVLGLVIL